MNTPQQRDLTLGTVHLVHNAIGRGEESLAILEEELGRYRQFYRIFPIASALRTQLNWTQYKVLISIENEDKRAFYIAESVKNNWSARQLERQVNSQLFERLLLSNDVESVLQVARAEKIPTEPKEIIKDPMVLEFLGLKREALPASTSFIYLKSIN